MSSLDTLQAFMAEAVRSRRDLRLDPELVRRAAEYFSGNERLTPIDQLEIYREQYWLRHTTALVEDFPGLGGILGQRDWERLIEDYLVASPPTSFSLRDLGRGLPEFVDREATWLEHRRLCADMARLEWADVELFDAALPPRLDPGRLAEVGGEWDAARLVLSPALRLLRCDYPVLELRKRLRTSGAEPVPLPDPEAERLLVYRADLEIVHERLDPAPFLLLEVLASGASLGQACERACALGSESAARVNADIGAWFATWAERGLVVDVVPSATR